MSSLPIRWLSLFRHGAIARTRKGACTEISRSFPRWVDIVAWPVQRRFAYREKFQKLFKDRGEIRSNLGYSTSFTRKLLVPVTLYGPRK